MSRSRSSSFSSLSASRPNGAPVTPTRPSARTPFTPTIRPGTQEFSQASPTIAPTTPRGASPSRGETLEQLLDRILQELRGHRRGPEIAVEIAGSTGPLRARLLKFLRQFFDDQVKRGVATQTAAAAAGAWIDGFPKRPDTKIAEMQAELSEARARTAQVKSELSQVQADLLKVPQASKELGTEVAEARADAAFARAQLANIKITLQRSEERAQTAEEMRRLADTRADDAEAALQAMVEDSQRTEKELEERAQMAEMTNLNKLKEADERRERAEQLKRRADDHADLETGRLRRAERRAQRAEERLDTVAAGLEGEVSERRDLCPHCGRPIDGFPETGARVARTRAGLLGDKVKADIYPSVRELKAQEAEELANLMRIYRLGGEFNAGERLGARYHRKLCDDLIRRCISGWRSTMLHDKFDQKVREDEVAQDKLKEMQQLHARKDQYAAHAAEKLADMYQAKLQKSMKTKVTFAWHTLSAKAQAKRKVLQHEKQLADMQARNAWQIERGGEMAEQVAIKYDEKRMRKFVQTIVFIWSDDVRRNSARRRIERELDRLMNVPRKERLSDEVIAQKGVAFRRLRELSIRVVYYAAWSNYASKSHEEKRIREDLSALAAEQEELFSKALTRADQMAAKMIKMRNENTKLAFLGAWSQVARTEKKEKAKDRFNEGMDVELDRMKRARLQELADVRNQKGTDQNGRTQRPNNFAWKQRTDMMAEVSFRKANLPLVRAVLEEWHEAVMQVASTRERERVVIDIQNIAKRAHRRGAQGKDLENIADKYYLHTGGRDYLTIWRRNVIELRVQRRQEKRRNAMEFERQKDDRSHEDLRKEQERWMKGKKDDFTKKLEHLKSAVRDSGDRTAEKMADVFRKRSDLDMLLTVVTRWRVRASTHTAQRQRREHEAQLQSIQDQKEEEIKKVKKIYASEVKKGGPIADQLGLMFARKLRDKMLFRCISAWGKIAREAFTERFREELEAAFEEEISRAMQFDLKNDEEAAEFAADVLLAKRMNRVMYRSLQGWFAAMLQLKTQRHQEEVQMMRQKGLDDLKKQDRNAGDAKANLLAKNFRRKAEYEIKRKVWFALLQEVDDSKDAKKEAKLAQTYETDLEYLRQLDRDRGDEVAEQMAATFYRKKCVDWMEMAIRAWLGEVHAAKLSRTEAEMRIKNDRDLEDLRRKTRFAADRTAESMADQFYRRVCHHLLSRCWTAWQHYLALEMQDKEKRELLRRAETNLELVRRDVQSTADAEREQQGLETAKVYEKKVYQAVMKSVLSAWRLWHSDRKAAFHVQELKEQYQVDIEELRQKERQKGDKTAKELAEKFNRSRCFDLLKELVTHWRHWVKDEKERQEDEEIERRNVLALAEAEKQRLEEKEENAIKAAAGFRRKQLWLVVAKCLAAWDREGIRVKVNRDARQAKELYDTMNAAIQRRYDNTAEGISRQLYVRRNYIPAIRCLWAWYHNFFLDVKEYQQELEFAELKEKWEDDMGRMMTSLNERQESLKRDKELEQEEFRRVLLLQRILMAWLQVRVDQQAQTLVVATQKQFEGDVSDFVRSQGKLKRKLVVQVSEQYLKLMKKPIQQGFFNTWHLIALLTISRKQAFADRTAMQQYTKAATSVATRRSETSIKRLGEHIAWMSKLNLMRRTFAAIREDKWCSILNRTIKQAARTLKEELDTAREERAAQAAKYALELAQNWNRSGETTVVLQCFHAWRRDTLNTILQNRHQKDVQKLLHNHKAEVEEIERDHVWDEFNNGPAKRRSENEDPGPPPNKRAGKGRKYDDDDDEDEHVERRGSPKKTQKDVDADETSWRRGGPKKRLEYRTSESVATRRRSRGAFANRLLEELDREEEEIQERRRENALIRAESRRKRPEDAEDKSWFSWS